MSIPVKVTCHRDYHLNMDGNLSMPVPQPSSFGETRIVHHLDVLVPGESVNEFPADDIQVTIAVKICNTGGRGTVSGDRKRPSILEDSVIVLDQVDIALEGAVLPVAFLVVGVVPPIVFPSVDAYDYVLITVSVKVHIFPGVASLPFKFDRIALVWDGVRL